MDLLQNLTWLKFLTLLTSLFLGPFLLPPLLFFFVPISLFFIVPIIFTLISVTLFCKIFALVLPIRILGKKLYRRTSKPVYKDSNNKNTEMVIPSLGKQVSMELDPTEFPYLYESDEEEEGQNRGVIGSNNRFCMHEKDSRQFLVKMPMMIKEHKSFHETLSYWKQKERGDFKVGDSSHF